MKLIHSPPRIIYEPGDIAKLPWEEVRTLASKYLRYTDFEKIKGDLFPRELLIQKLENAILACQEFENLWNEPSPTKKERGGMKS